MCTIQRIEKGQKASLESLKSLAAVFELQVSDLQETAMNSHVGWAVFSSHQIYDFRKGLKSTV